MLKRLLFGMLIGLVIGGGVAAGIVRGLGIPSFAGVSGGLALAYAAAAVVGAVTGLVAGKPIWAKGGKLEAGLKSFFGAVLAAGGLFALRRWAHVDVDLSAFGAGAGSLGDLPATALPLLGAGLGCVFELDNTPQPESTESSKQSPAAGARVAAKQRVGSAAEPDEGDAEERAAGSRRKR